MTWLLPQLPPKFEAALRDVNAASRDARVAAAERLASVDDSQLEAALDALSKLAVDREVHVRKAAVRSLGELDDARAVHVLEARLADAEGLVREHAAISLGMVSAADAVAVLERALSSEHPEVRFQALAGYVERTQTPAVDIILALLEDDDVQVRAQAARALGEMPTHAELTTPKLVEALRDAEAAVQREAAFALSQLGNAAGRAQLVQALDERSDRLDALEAIAALGLRELADDVARILARPWVSLPERMTASRSLVRLGDERGVASLRDALRSFFRTRRDFALAAVAELSVGALVAEVVALSTRPTRVDGDLLIDALTALAPEHAPARDALAALASARGALADRARAALEAPPEPVSDRVSAIPTPPTRS